MANNAQIQHDDGEKQRLIPPEQPSTDPANDNAQKQFWVLLRKVVYQKRKFDKTKVLARASGWKNMIDDKVKAGEAIDVKYNLFVQNCEHFACACAIEPGVGIQGAPNVRLQSDPNVEIQGDPDVDIQCDTNVDIQDDPDVDIQCDTNVDIQDDPDVDIQDDPKDPNVDIPDDPNVGIQDDPNVDIQDDPNVDIQDDPDFDIQDHPNVEIQGDPNVGIQGDPNVDIQDDPNVGIQSDPDVEIQALKKSMSLQCLESFSIAISLLLWALQAVFYGFNFWMYAVFVQRDCNFEFLSHHKRWLEFLCYWCYSINGMSCKEFVRNFTDPELCMELPENNYHGAKYFETHCDWIISCVIAVASLFIFCLLICLYYNRMKKRKYICKPCFFTVLIHQLLSRNIVFFLIELITIISERVLYKFVTCWKLSRFWTIFMLFIVCTLGALCAYSLASLITRVIVVCCSSNRSSALRWCDLLKCRLNRLEGCCRCLVGCIGCCMGCKCCCERCKSCCEKCKCEKGHDKYVPFRGLLRCCCENNKSKYLNRDSKTTEDGCMMCRLEIPIYDFKQLEPGDHISMPGSLPFFNYLYDHHAIVASIEDISVDGKEAKITVIDVSRKGMKNLKWCCRCNCGPLPIEQHSLYNARRHRLTSSRWIHGYRRRLIDSVNGCNNDRVWDNSGFVGSAEYGMGNFTRLDKCCNGHRVG